MGNKELETQNTRCFYVITAGRDGVRKYISRDFPHLFSYTVKLNKAYRFYNMKTAQSFLDRFSCIHTIQDPEIHEVTSTLVLSEEV